MLYYYPGLNFFPWRDNSTSDTFPIYDLWLLKFSAIDILAERFWEMNPDMIDRHSWEKPQELIPLLMKTDTSYNLPTAPNLFYRQLQESIKYTLSKNAG